MPYEMYKDENKWCVRNSETGESKGCSDSKKMARRHMGALYAHEKKEAERQLKALALAELSDDEPEETQEKSTEQPESVVKNYYDAYDSVYPTSMATSYAELENMEDAMEYKYELQKLIDEFPMLASNIIARGDIEDKSSAIVGLAQELGDRISEKESDLDDEKEVSDSKEANIEPIVARVINFFKGLLTKEKDVNSFMSWKEADGTWRWFARYSNTFRDRDNPPEIISSKSHRRFVELVDEGTAPYPELWLWHVPDWKVGVATWVAYDEVKENAGFAMAAGYFYPGCEQIAEWLSKQEDFRVSHGMPTTTIQRDESDKSVIVQHETREISPLPGSFAANEITSFNVLKEESNMAIPAEKRRTLIETYNLPEEAIARVEGLNKNDASKAIQEGIETKEDNSPAAPAVTEPVAPVETTEPAKEEEVETQTQSPYPTREEVAEALQPLADALVSMTAVIEGLNKSINELKTSREEEVNKAIKSTPQASLLAMITGRAVGDKSAEVEKDSGLANSHPKEAEKLSNKTGIPFLDQMLNQ